MSGNITNLRSDSLIPTDNIELEYTKLYGNTSDTRSNYAYLLSADRKKDISNYQMLNGYSKGNVMLGVIDGYYPPAEWRDPVAKGEGKTYPALTGRQGVDIPKLNIIQGTTMDTERLAINSAVLENTANDRYFTQKTLYIV
jgi:hypothetical protein